MLALPARVGVEQATGALHHRRVELVVESAGGARWRTADGAGGNALIAGVNGFQRRPARYLQHAALKQGDNQRPQVVIGELAKLRYRFAKLFDRAVGVVREIAGDLRVLALRG